MMQVFNSRGTASIVARWARSLTPFSHLKPSANPTKHPFGTLFAQCLHNGYTPIKKQIIYGKKRIYALPYRG